MNTGKIIKTLREDAKLSQREFAKFIGEKSNNISHYETDRKQISISRLKKIAEKFNRVIKVKFFLEDKESYDWKIKKLNKKEAENIGYKNLSQFYHDPSDIVEFSHWYNVMTKEEYLSITNWTWQEGYTQYLTKKSK